MMANQGEPHVSDGARLGHGDLSPVARDPLPEPFYPIPDQAYRFDDGVNRNQPRPRIIPFFDNDDAIQPEIFVVRDFRDHDEPHQAYARIPGKDPVDINHHWPTGWGEVFFCHVYQRSVQLEDRTFQQTLPVPQCVAVKRLRKTSVQEYLAVGGQENPYVEVLRMREIGDNKHVLKCIEFLQDSQWLYIVTPMAAGTDATLAEVIWDDDLDEMLDWNRICAIFEKILRILIYLETNGICHRDLSPDNFLFLTDDNLVAFDLAMSIRIPFDDDRNVNRQRSLIRSRSPCGTLFIRAPEVHSGQVFDGIAIDLWAASVTLYSLLTKQSLYSVPHRADHAYNFFVAARNLSSNPLNQEAVDLFQAADDRTQRRLFFQATRHVSRFIPQDTLIYLEHLLAVAPRDRLSLAEAYEQRPTPRP
jgi:serine/threonine protein kinase